ncbi:translation factor [Mycena floridula]|nr:translation factor [Mycena floridula]
MSLRALLSSSSLAMATRVLKCNPSSISFLPSSHEPQISCPETLDSLLEASNHLVDLLRPVAFPTETVYGLGASALSISATSQIFAAKGRPPDNPLIVHVSSLQMLDILLAPGFTIPQPYHKLIRSFWPGALTLLFPSNPDVVPSIVTANLPTVAVRMPSHPVARALIAIANIPLAAPSANSSGKPSPTRPEHVLRDLEGKVGIILDGGPCDVGLESTVVDGLGTDGNIRVLRPGGVTIEDIERALQLDIVAGQRIPQVLVHGRDFRDKEMEDTPTTPGMKYRHYSPAVPVTLLMTLSPPPEKVEAISAANYLADLKNLRQDSSRPFKVGLLASTDSALSMLPLPTDGLEWHRHSMGSKTDLAFAARSLFDGLLTLERDGVDLILVEEVDQRDEGLAVMNRVRKAAGETKWISFC